MTIHPISRKEFWLAEIALFLAIALQVGVWALKPHLTAGPQQLIIPVEIALAVLLAVSAPRRHKAEGALHRRIVFLLMGLISAVNISSFILVMRDLVTAGAHLSGKELLASAIAILLTNIIVFGLWYWEIDSPGLSGRKWSKHDQDFQFTQQERPANFPGWQASFADYLYLSLTNAVNFAPADARPLTSQAKALMGVQSLVSVFTLALVLARSVSILG
ncbi:MAG TPA: hypothetical protein VLE73_06155 [Candidatus Saccharimonadales bacterium]|nr:hypothetical protein [Candidatus Saccharimonadales bacterium]